MLHRRKLFAQLRGLSLVVLEMHESGDEAYARVSTLAAGRDSEEQVRLVRIDGRWYFATSTPLASVAPMPSVPAPTAAFT